MKHWKKISGTASVMASAGIVLLVSSVAHAGGNGAGNGGNAVKIKNAMYLLDFVEAGIEKDPDLSGWDPKRSVEHEYDRRFSRAFKNQISLLPFEGDVKEILHDKLMGFWPMERYLILATMRLYQWTILDLPLARTQDLSSPLDLSKLSVYQAAVRRDAEILINRSIWNKMNAANRAGLILHEVLYASLNPQSRTDGTQFQNSWDARRIVGQIFKTPHFRGLDQFKRNGKPVLSFFNGSGRKNYGNVLRANLYNYDSTYEIAYSPDVVVYESLEKSNLYPHSTINGWPAEGSGQDLSMADDGIYYDGADEPFELEWNDDSTRNAIQMECTYNFPARDWKGFVAATLGRVHVTLKDYSTAEGPTKYVSVNYHATPIAGYIGSNTDVTDTFEVQYGSVEECKKDLFDKAMQLKKLLGLVEVQQ